jgi:Family of unknown function (DUF6134)
MTEKAIGGGARWFRAALLACLVAVGATALPLRAAEAAPLQLTYRVTHSTFGEIGTYTNTIEPVAGGITVQTRAHFHVKMLGVNLYNEDAQRTERWQGNRLVSFDGVTSKGSESMTVRGAARGNSFVINTPHGTITAPGTVHPANPWSANFLDSNTMMRPDDGSLEAVRISAGQPTVIDLDGRPIRARKYEVVGTTRYDIWLDDQGVPVKFAVDDNSGKVTFTLASCSRCAVGQQLGMK